MFQTLENLVDRWSPHFIVPARVLLTILFLHEATTLLFAFSPAAAAMSKQGVPVSVFAGVIALQLVAGLMILLGWHGRLGALALGGFCVMTAFGFHTNLANQNELLHFEKDLAIAGGMFVLVILGTGRLSLDRIV